MNIIQLPKNVQYKWNIEYQTTNKNFDDIFPVQLYIKYLSVLNNLLKTIGDDFFMLADIVTSYNYLTFVKPRIVKDYDRDKIYEKYIMELEDSRKIVYKSFYKSNINRNKLTILTYKFDDISSIVYYEIIKSHKLLKQTDKIMIISKDKYALDTIIHYQKFINNYFLNKNITMLIYPLKNEENITKINNLAKNSDIDPIVLDNIMDNVYIKSINDKIKDKDFVIIDSDIHIQELYYTKTNFVFQPMLGKLIIGLACLNKNGNMILRIWNITNKMVFNFILYLSTLFKNSFIHKQNFDDYAIQYDYYVFEGYNGNVDLDKLYEINKNNHLYDSTNGYNYQIANEKEKKLFNDTYVSPNKPEKFLDNIIDIQTDYTYYTDYIKNVYENKINFLEKINNLHINYNENAVKKILEYNLLYSINYAKKIGLEIVDWIDPQKNKQYFYHNLVNNLYKNIGSTTILLEKNKNIDTKIKLELSKKLDFDKELHTKIKNLNYLHELSYAYHEKESKELFNGLVLYINFNQKKLEKMLLSKHNININNKYVSRAWTKLYELYAETHFFDNLNKNKISGFHICEAPGNFIMSTMYYLKKKTSVKEYIWNAQSLYEGNVYDHYKFIEKTKDKWDFGKDKSGDLTKYENLLYYIKKYKGVDILVGDCGIGVSTNLEELHDLANYQLIYSLLIPKKGGNFIIKTHANNINLQFLSLLYLVYIKYNKLYIFKSSQNFWSSEIYIVGIGFDGLSKEEEEIILQIGENLEKGIRLYPVEKISDEFIALYESIISKIIDRYTNIKKFLVYLIRNPDKIKTFKKNIVDAIDERNKKWIKQYII